MARQKCFLCHSFIKLSIFQINSYLIKSCFLYCNPPWWVSNQGREEFQSSFPSHYRYSCPRSFLPLPPPPHPEWGLTTWTGRLLSTINLYYHYELVSSYNNLTNNILLPANQKLLPVSKLSFLAPTTDRAWPLVFIYFVLFTTELWQLTMVCRESRSGQQTVSSSTTRGIMRPVIGMRVFSDRPHGWKQCAGSLKLLPGRVFESYWLLHSSLPHCPLSLPGGESKSAAPPGTEWDSPLRLHQGYSAIFYLSKLYQPHIMSFSSKFTNEEQTQDGEPAEFETVDRTPRK